MANLGNLIVRGVTRILGDAYANKFIGNLQGNADTATSAIKASTADSATSATSANKASIATAVQDYGTSNYREIKIGYNGSGLSSSTITHAVGFTDGGTKIKDISKEEFRNWLATASGTWNISITGNAATATNADTLDGYHAQVGHNKPWGMIPVITNSGYMDVGKHFEFHYDNTTGSDYSTVLGCTGNYGNVVNLPSKNGTLALTIDNVASASKWATPRTITLTGSVTGSVSIDGSANVTLATTTNHTHNYAGSSSAGGSANSALTLLYSNKFDTNYGDYAVFQQDSGRNDFPHSGWFNSIKMLHNNSNGYFTEIAMSFTGEDGMWRRSLIGGGQLGWYKMLDSGNFNSYALPLSGGTLTGSVTMRGIDTDLIRDIVYDGTSGWARDLIALQVDGVRKFAISAFGDYTAGASSNGIYYGYIGCNSYDGLNLRISDTSITWGDNPILHSSNFNSYAPTLTGTGASGTWGINISGNAASASNASAVNGISLTWDGEITSSQWIAAWESGTSIRTMSAYNTFISMCSYLDEGSSDVTDGTMFITSYATDNGFADPNGKNKPYKRKASFLWNYINNKCSSIYATQSWVNSNYYTCSESDSRYIQSETDPVWTAAKGNYYTKTECDNRYQPKGTYLTEQNLQGYATQEWVRGEEYLYRSGGTMDARAEIGITTKLFIGNSTSPDTCYTKFNCILHGGGDESNPNWVIRDNGYAEFKSSVSANAFYASSDIRLKNILDDINVDFDKLKLIPKKYYTWKGSDILQLGTIAQDIQKIYPEVVSKNENGYLSVDYSKLSIIALAAIDKLNERIKELECQIKL